MSISIKDIRDPSFLKDLSIAECRELSDEIRVFLIDTVSKTGGHIASNLGVVELTVAMHKVFNAPEDRILFDVGHQSYVHKILTGRADQMDTLRQFHGSAGFQKRKESVYDGTQRSGQAGVYCRPPGRKDLRGSAYGGHPQ